MTIAFMIEIRVMNAQRCKKKVRLGGGQCARCHPVSSTIAAAAVTPQRYRNTQRYRNGGASATTTGEPVTESVKLDAPTVMR